MQPVTDLRGRFAGFRLRAATGVVLATAAIAAGCSSNDDTTTTLKASSVTVVSGNTQSGTVATAVTAPLVVQVKDQNGAPMNGVQVTFTVTGGGTLGSPTAVTDASGNASTTLTLGNTSGAVTVTAAVSGVTQSAVFTATANAGAPTALVVVSGNNQSATAGTILPVAIVARVNDQFGNAVSGVTVNWATTGGQLAGTAQSTSDATGTASTTLTLPALAGAVTITATVPNTTLSVTFSETAM